LTTSGLGSKRDGPAIPVVAICWLVDVSTVEIVLSNRFVT
jgi:hypothetical protein